MEKISSNGEVYVKASSIAQELGYTADYVGQLCRSGQVDAQLVGRSWFVNEDSIREHKRNRYRSTKAKSQKWVRESLAHPTTPPATPIGAPRPQPELNVRYENDESDMIPSLGAKMPVEESHVSEAVSEQDEEERSVPLRFEAESVHQEENESVDEVLDDHTREVEEVQRDSVVEEDADTYMVPLRKPAPIPVRRPDIVAPPRSAVKMEHRAQIKADVVQEVSEEESNEEHEREQGISNRAERIVLAASLATAVALVGAITLVGLESHHVVDQSGTLYTYQFNLASAIEAWSGASKSAE